MPESIRRFEFLYLAVAAIGLVNIILTYNAVSASIPAELGSGFMPIVLIVTFGILVGLILLISRGRKNWAKWVLVVLTAFGLINWALSMSVSFEISVISGSLGAIQALLQIAAIYMLFQPDAKAYLGRRAEA